MGKLTTNLTTCEAFWNYFFLISLMPIWVTFLGLKQLKLLGETELENWEALKLVSQDKNHSVYLRQSLFPCLN